MPDRLRLALATLGQPDVVLSTETSTGHFAIGVLVVLGTILLTLYLFMRAGDANLPDEQRVIRDQIRGALDESPVTTRFSGRAIREGELSAAEIRTELQALFDADESPEPDTLARGFREVTAAIASVWRDQTRRIPDRVLSLGEWAIAVLIFGSIAVASSTIVALLDTSPGRPDLSDVMSALGDGASEGGQIAVSLISAFPFFDVLFAFGMLFVMQAAQSVFVTPWALAAVMLLVAGVLLVLEWRIGGDADPLPLVRKRVFAAALGGLLVTWAVGVVVATVLGRVFGAVGLGIVADIIAFLAATLVFAWLGYLSISWLRMRIRRASPGPDVESLPVGALYLGRFSASILRPVAIVAVLAWTVAALSGGQFATVVSALVNAAPEIQLTVGLAVVTVLGAFAWEVRAAAPEVRRILVELQAREQRKTAVALSTMPYMGVLMVFLGAWAWQFPIVLAVMLAIFGGLVFRIGVSLYRQSRKRYADRDQPDHLPRSLLVGARRVETAAGELHFLTVRGTHYAHPERKAVVDMVVGVCRQLATSGAADPTVEEWFAEFASEYGLADYDETYRVEYDRVINQDRSHGKLAERARKQILTALRESDTKKVHREELLDDHCEELPREVARTRLDEMLLTPGLREQAGGVVWLKRDIWAKQARAAPRQNRVSAAD